ncbi:bacitracin transport system permease protein [Metabacillus crassostreae]|uniref:ABC transporter permease n=1 Tax=Metabacillus crassostreae TaxID=929098 RepID=UPI00195A9109|nr:ABC transporter permease [Metabacillus crassostreae]MBM7603752.1 bacitracin transport system permease protein [Metabacillus crassostreae]
MVNLLVTEVLKLKRSRMFLISIIGAAVAPFMVVVASYIHMHTKANVYVAFDELFYQTNLYTVLVLGVPLYGVVTAYLITREYTEDTLKNLLTIPVSRSSFLLSKITLLFLWICLLTFVAWSLAVVLGLIFQFKGLNSELLLQSIKQFSIGAGLLFVLSSPIIFVTLVSKSYVPTIIFTIVITMLNVMGGSSEHRGLFPWAAAGDISNHTLLPTYDPAVSYIIITLTSLVGFISSFVYFRRVDV